jgi:enoyl-CoA hydratase/carnithine racemase
MATALRRPTLETLGLGGVHDIFSGGKLPASPGDTVDEVFGPAGTRGALVISGANGIVGAGKMMQLGARLEPFGVRLVGLDFPSAPDGIGKQYPGLVRAFGPEGAGRIMGNIIRLSYDGKTLPEELKQMRPCFLLEAIPEILELKKAHYEIFREAFPAIEIRSVTSGFPSRELGVGIAHPAFPHEINKLYEVVEDQPSAVTRMLWALGLVPVPVSDDWSFVLDVLFCGITHAGTHFHHASNMPYWKIDKFVRKMVGPNPFRAHDAIGAAGANFLTWSCLHHLGKTYGDLFTPTAELTAQKESGQNWYPPNHFRPLVDWSMDADEEEDFRSWILGPLYQMTSLMLHEKRGHLTHMNMIGELCAQFRKGILAMIRDEGPEGALRRVAAYHRLHPEAAGSAWHPETFEQVGSPEWQQLYVNAEHDGTVGVISLARESYNGDVNAELNRAIDWLKDAGIERVILTGDFHLSTQHVGADTSEFFPALEKVEEGTRVSGDWSRTARRLHEEFKTSVGFINGKRCLGGMLELMLHCHAVVAVEDARLGFPEVTLPVVPGMEGCHWPFRKAASEHWPKLMGLLLGGRPVRADQGVGWLVDQAAPMDQAIAAAWKTAAGDGPLPSFEGAPLKNLPGEPADLPPADGPAAAAARKAILDCIRDSCALPVAEALEVQAKHSAGFMLTAECRAGAVGAEYSKTMKV